MSTLSRDRFDKVIGTFDLNAHTPRTITSPKKLWQNILQVKRLGYAADDREFIGEMVSIAVPIVAKNGKLLMTLSFHAPTLRMEAAEAVAQLSVLKSWASKLAELYECH